MRTGNTGRHLNSRAFLLQLTRWLVTEGIVNESAYLPLSESGKIVQRAITIYFHFKFCRWSLSAFFSGSRVL